LKRTSLDSSRVRPDDHVDGAVGEPARTCFCSFTDKNRDSTSTRTG